MSSLLSIAIGFLIGLSYNNNEVSNDVILLPEDPYYVIDEVDEDILYRTLVHYEFPNPSVITAQAVLESGNFTSKLCHDKNNLFGLYNSKKKQYYEFDSWISCVFAYKDFILNKYKDGENYYKFLHRINYAEDPAYIEKLKRIEKRINEKHAKKNTSHHSK